MDQARSHLSPKGGQSPALFAGDWPPAGALACGNADAEGEAGYAIGCGEIDMGVDEGIDMGVAVPFEGLSRAECGRPHGGRGWAAELPSAAASAEGASQRTAIRVHQEVPTGGNCRGGSRPGGDDPPVTRYKAGWHGRIVTAGRV
jgi:hypothetical protein